MAKYKTTEKPKATERAKALDTIQRCVDSVPVKPPSKSIGEFDGSEVLIAESAIGDPPTRK